MKQSNTKFCKYDDMVIQKCTCKSEFGAVNLKTNL